LVFVKFLILEIIIFSNNPENSAISTLLDLFEWVYAYQKIRYRIGSLIGVFILQRIMTPFEIAGDVICSLQGSNCIEAKGTGYDKLSTDAIEVVIY
jgi:hypothetical protein